MANLQPEDATLVVPNASTIWPVAHDPAGGSAYVPRGVGLAGIREYLGDTVKNQASADQAVAASTTIYVAGSDLAIPSWGMKVGSRFYWVVQVTKTGTLTGVPVATIRFGTNGTTADATLATFTFPAGTAVADEGTIEIWATAIANGATATMRAMARFTHSLATTGWMTVPASTLRVDIASFNSTVANSKMGVTFTGGTSPGTIRMCQSSAENM